MCVVVLYSGDPSEVNISDEMAKSGIWKSVSMTSDSSKALKRCKRYKISGSLTNAYVFWSSLRF